MRNQYDDFPVLPPRNKRKRPPMDPDNKPWAPPTPNWNATIHCQCGWDSGIGTISHLVLYNDVVCPNCQQVVITVNRPIF